VSIIAILLAVALVASNGAWLYYLRGRDGRDRDERAELWTRIQHPALVTPRQAVEYTPPEEPEWSFDERELAGSVQQEEIIRNGDE
jgi:hypothetical protein